MSELADIWQTIETLDKAIVKLRNTLDLLVAAQGPVSKEREEDRQKVRQREHRETLAKHQREEGREDIGVAQRRATDPADEGTPPGYKEVGVLCFDLVDVKLPEDLLQLPGGFKLGKFELRLRGYRWIREYPVYQLTDDGEESEEGHYD